MKTTLTSLFIFLACFLGKTIACDCFPIPDFCQTITFQNNGDILDWLNIYRVKVMTKTANGINVFVSQTYHGENITGHQIFFADGNGADCVLFVTQFNVGDELIVTASKQEDTWYISECGITFLKVENGMVNGPIAPSLTQVPLGEFAALANCGDLTSAPTPEPSEAIAMLVQPTLAYDQVVVKTKGISTTDLRASVFDVNGRLIHQFVLPQGSTFYGEQVPVGNWATGVYFFKLEAMGREEVFKIVKMDSK